MDPGERTTAIWKEITERGFIIIHREDIIAILLTAAADERESCANVAEDLYGNEPPMDYNRDLQKAGRNIAEAIRNRRESK